MIWTTLRSGKSCEIRWSGDARPRLHSKQCFWLIHMISKGVHKLVSLSPASFLKSHILCNQTTDLFIMQPLLMSRNLLLSHTVSTIQVTQSLFSHRTTSVKVQHHLLETRVTKPLHKSYNQNQSDTLLIININIKFKNIDNYNTININDCVVIYEDTEENFSGNVCKPSNLTP